MHAMAFFDIPLQKLKKYKPARAGRAIAGAAPEDATPTHAIFRAVLESSHTGQTNPVIHG